MKYLSSQQSSCKADDVCSQQFDDVKEKVEELIPQLDRFKQNISATTVDGDPEETDRRVGLTRYVLPSMTIMTATANRRSTFKQVEELSQKLSAKSAFIRFADRGEDAKVVARLIERLREAIVCYQVRHRYPPQSSAADRGPDIPTASDLPSNHSSHSKPTPSCP